MVRAVVQSVVRYVAISIIHYQIPFGYRIVIDSTGSIVVDGLGHTVIAKI